ncbi:hypothetical protein FSP39_009025 [Pinctada imbricata]|uniref:C1q domain-containing protein n=1 Tax=Pinctada imbricata TaxID=66713 RepID=A0AA89C9T7_PINIB|nr:hypothetical protein FSP39_009025 [Pinctada imbricata]
MSGGSSDDCNTYIYNNGNKMMMSYSHDNGGSGNEEASTTILLSLMTGDHVWIETAPGSVYCHGYPYTGFSGWKL